LGPWLALCGLTALLLFLVPVWSLLEGCNQVAQTYAQRLIQVILSRLALWLALLLGARLWTGPVSSAIALVWAGLFLWWRYRRFIGSLLSSERESRIRWRADIWPMQWRIALSWLSGYLVFSLFTPVLFYFHGPVVAGQTGMTVSLISTLSMISYTFVATKVPRFGILIAQREHGTLDRLFFRAVLSSSVVAGLGAIAIGGGVLIINLLQQPLAERILPPMPTALFLLALLPNQITIAMAAYLRAHKREPYLVIQLVSAIAATASTLILGSRLGALGVAAGLLVVNGSMLLPAGIIFFRRRAEWHARPAVSPAR
jgi:O-antigen/teichoic acid export membrane protein